MLIFYILLPFWTMVNATCPDSCSRIKFNVKNGEKGKVLDDHGRLDEITVGNDVECFVHCQRSLHCTSFNVCGGKSCQLNERNRFAGKRLKTQPGCVYYDFPLIQACGNTSPQPPSYICASEPCLNGGVCDVNISDVTRRFFCKCLLGYYGDQCEAYKPKSCLDYWIGPRKPLSGEYKIEDDYGTVYPVFCDFDSEEGTAWTLVESFAAENVNQVLRSPFTLDHPINEDNFNWELYRLPKSVMMYIRSQSKYWRATCSFPKYGIDYRDYLRVRMSELDPIVYHQSWTYTPKACKLVDYLDVKGKLIKNCTVAILQDDYLINMEPHTSITHGCSCDLSTIIHQCSNGEYGFILSYSAHCPYPGFRCAEDLKSTNEIWFGEAKV